MVNPIPSQQPRIIQGGMGIAVSSWKLARSVSQLGELGVISGTAIDSVIARRLQDGDLDGSVRRALAHFPDQEIADSIIKRFFIDGGKPATTPYFDVPKLILKPTIFALHMLIASTYVEVWLAKENHDGLIGMNLLEKIQMAIPAQLYGAMLAGVDYVLVGAGIPGQIPRLLNDLSAGNRVQMKVELLDTTDKYHIDFDPHCVANISYPLVRPHFLAIVSSHALVAYLNKDDETKPDGFVIEYHVAGGHNAPPRAKNHIDESNEAIYSDADIPNIEKILASGSPFWLAGGFGTPEKLQEALQRGAQGIQVGSLFALANESGFTQELRSSIIKALAQPDLRVITDASASPTGFPFKVIALDQTLSDKELFNSRLRNCDLGYLRSPFKRENGGIGYRCPAEPVATFEFKNGDSAQASESKCLCNALMSDIGMAQIRPDGRSELALITIGSDLDGPRRLVQLFPDGWGAQAALEFLTRP